MKIHNATPPADFPEQVIVLDKDFAEKHAEKAVYLRVARAGLEVNIVALDGEVTLPGAVRAAIARGFTPTHWMEAADGRPALLPASVLPRRLIDGTTAPALDATQSLALKTKCPEKWLAIDLETGDVWRGTPTGWKHHPGEHRKAIAELVAAA